MQEDVFIECDGWLNEAGPQQNVVVSSRARFARNISRYPFATHAKSDELAEVCRMVDETIRGLGMFRGYRPILLHDVSPVVRMYLKESHIISSEMERGKRYRFVYLSPDYHTSIMVNEEDHLRIQGIVSGLRLKEIFGEISKIDVELTDALPVAFSERFGFLTACPSNLGTGLRVSVMLHLPGLVYSRQIDEILKIVQPFGLTVRGFYGENSEFTGDFYQISNEVSLGKSEGEIIETLLNVIKNVIGREEVAREELFKSRPYAIEDIIWRSFGLLSQARMMNSQEAMKLLSRIRFGIDRGYFKNIDHYVLNKLVIELQPAHLQYQKGGEVNSKARDIARATLLRNYFNAPGSEN